MGMGAGRSSRRGGPVRNQACKRFDTVCFVFRFQVIIWRAKCRICIQAIIFGVCVVGHGADDSVIVIPELGSGKRGSADSAGKIF